MTGFFSERAHVIPVLAPIDIIATDVTTDVVDAGEMTRGFFVVNFGVVTGDTCTIFLYECDDIVPTNSTAIAFNYRLSSAVGTDVMGAITAATAAAGYVAPATVDGKCVVVEVDPAALSAGYPYVKLGLVTGASMSACLVSATFVAEPRNAQNVVASMVD
jgi:hypothetical protein